MVFKITDEPFGQLSYTPRLPGHASSRAASTATPAPTGCSASGRIVRMHANDRQDIDRRRAGRHRRPAGVDCASGDTLCGEGVNYSLESIYVAEPVISLSVTRQQRRPGADGQGPQPLHEGGPDLPRLDRPGDRRDRHRGHGRAAPGRLRRADAPRVQGPYVTVGAPSVSYREAPTVEAKYDYRHKKQTGGSGQFAHVVGRLIPLPPGSDDPYEFEDNITSGRIPGEYIPAVNKGFQAAMKKGPLAGYEVVGCKMCLDDGSLPRGGLQRNGLPHRGPRRVHRGLPQVQALPDGADHEGRGRDAREYQGAIVGDLNSRRGIIIETEAAGTCAVVRAEVPLASMFGYATIVRGLSKGMATFSMDVALCPLRPASLSFGFPICFKLRASGFLAAADGSFEIII
jgi:elongation factor G